MTTRSTTAALTPPRLDADATHVGHWEWDILSGAIRFDAQWAALLGEASDELHIPVGEWMARVHPDDLIAARMACQRHLGGHTESYVSSIRVRHRDGTWRRVQDEGRVVERDAYGNALRMAGTHTVANERTS